MAIRAIPDIQSASIARLNGQSAARIGGHSKEFKKILDQTGSRGTKAGGRTSQGRIGQGQASDRPSSERDKSRRVSSRGESKQHTSRRDALSGKDIEQVPPAPGANGEELTQQSLEIRGDKEPALETPEADGEAASNSSLTQGGEADGFEQDSGDTRLAVDASGVTVLGGGQIEAGGTPGGETQPDDSGALRENQSSNENGTGLSELSGGLVDGRVAGEFGGVVDTIDPGNVGEAAGGSSVDMAAAKPEAVPVNPDAIGGGSRVESHPFEKVDTRASVVDGAAAVGTAGAREAVDHGGDGDEAEMDGHGQKHPSGASAGSPQAGATPPDSFLAQLNPAIAGAGLQVQDVAPVPQAPVDGVGVSQGQASVQLPGSETSESNANVARVMRGMHGVLNQNGGAVTLRLSPPEMGIVRIEMQIENGTVKVQLHTEHESIRKLLTQQLGQLRGSLEVQGLNVDKLSVQTMGQDHSGFNADRDTEQSSRDGRSRGHYTGGGQGSGGQQESMDQDSSGAKGENEIVFERALNKAV